MTTKGIRETVVTLSERFPAIAQQLTQLLRGDIEESFKDPAYKPKTLEIYFDGQRVLRQEETVLEQQYFSPGYKPAFIFVFGDNELLLVQANGHLLLNRLPQESAVLPWKIYELN